MRIQMRPKGRPAAVRGSILTYNPVTGSFTVKFDVTLTGQLAGSPASISASTLQFVAGPDGSITDTTYHLAWEILNQ